MTLLERRRAMMRKKSAEDWTYILRADSTGCVEKAKIPVYSGQHVHVEWDTSRMSENDSTKCILSFFGQNTSFEEMNMVPYGQANYPILWNQQGVGTVFKGGYVDLDIPKNLNMFIGCWNDSQYASDNIRRLIGNHIKIRIT